MDGFFTEETAYILNSYLLNKIISEAYTAGLVLPDTRTTPYINTIPPSLKLNHLVIKI